MITEQQKQDFAEAHAQGLHDDLSREFCPECEDAEVEGSLSWSELISGNPSPRTRSDALDSCDCAEVGVYHSQTLTEPQNGSQRLSAPTERKLPRWLERSLLRDETGRVRYDH